MSIAANSIAAAQPTALSVSDFGAGDGWKLENHGWVQLTTGGDAAGLIHIQGQQPREVTQVLDAQAAEQMAQAFSGEGKETLIDYEHRAMWGGDSVAAGWIDAVEVRDGQLWAHVRWSAKGRTDIEGGNYRYLSPEFTSFVDLGNGRRRPGRLHGASLTNTPNLQLEALANKAAPANTNTPKIMDYKAELLKLCGLPADATDEQITTTAAELAATKQTATEAVAANKKAQADLAAMRSEMAATELAARNITSDNPAYKATLEAIVANKENGLLIADAICGAKPTASHYEVIANKVHPRTPTAPLDDDAVAANKQEAAVREYQSKHNCTYDVAFNSVRRSNPDLFKARK